ncbi:heparanase-like protein 1 isoform X1 [Cucurbita moschata]|uniref:Heparanase-like protein 1 isoform X1 n=1 Tax=Cucurbita moschata TaxID=3662 RepID=A0A6J1GWV3_CUCMO|nr:heparanase-like protein 1 isoform X1 [Cucurbita moschata]
MEVSQFLLVFLLVPVLTVVARDVTKGRIVVDGNTPVAETDENYVCMTLDVWPFNECPQTPCVWDGNASMLVLNLSLPTLTKAVEAFGSLRIRLGGTLQDKLIYDIGSFKGRCHPFERSNRSLFLITEGCLYMERWDELNWFFNKTGAIVTFGLNAILGRNNTIGKQWEGDWNYSNAEALIQYTIEKNYQINSWEFGNELGGSNSIGASITAAQYAKGLIKLREIIDRLYKNSRQKPSIVAPGAFFDASWYEDIVNETGPNVVDVLTHHVYNMGAGNDTEIIHKFLDPSYLSRESSTFQKLENVVQNHAPWTVAWVGEAGGAYGGGSPYVSNTFVDGFWYIDQLGMAALYNTKVYCRQTLVGGHYGVLRPQALTPSPDYYGALLFHRLMGRGVLKVDNNVSSYLRAYAHCSRERTGITMLFINMSNQTDFIIEIENHTNVSLAKKTSRIRQISKGGSIISELGAQREEYHLTPSNGLLKSPIVLLNGKVLEATEEGDLPNLTPVFCRSNSSISIATWSISFVVVPNFVAPGCK